MGFQWLKSGRSNSALKHSSSTTFESGCFVAKSCFLLLWSNTVCRVLVRLLVGKLTKNLWRLKISSELQISRSLIFFCEACLGSEVEYWHQAPVKVLTACQRLPALLVLEYGSSVEYRTTVGKPFQPTLNCGPDFNGRYLYRRAVWMSQRADAHIQVN